MIEDDDALSQYTMTELILKSSSPWDNPYQGKDKKVLFVCSAGVLRSATAARIYARKYNTRAAGSEPYALIPVTYDLLCWANEVVFVNQENYESCKRQFANQKGMNAGIDIHRFPCKIKVLNIPDKYEHMAPRLIDAFEQQYETIG